MGNAFDDDPRRAGLVDFKFVTRCDLGMPLNPEHGHTGHKENEVAVEDLPKMFKKSPDDVMLVVKQYMSDPQPMQIICLVPAHFRGKFIHPQPVGSQGRRPKSKHLVDSVEYHVPLLIRQGMISNAAAKYLVAFGQTRHQVVSAPSGIFRVLIGVQLGCFGGSVPIYPSCGFGLSF